MFTGTARRIVDLARDHARGQGSQDGDLPNLLAAAAGGVSCCPRLAQCLAVGGAGRAARRLPQTQFERAQELLAANRLMLDSLVRELWEANRLARQDLERLWGPAPSGRPPRAPDRRQTGERA
ncbi:MAG: hypothetical protein HY910_06635 [Desulfarculus sp.]|nr:hypothetical protein [Desulfarculus sp.]